MNYQENTKKCRDLTLKFISFGKYNKLSLILHRIDEKNDDKK